MNIKICTVWLLIIHHFKSFDSFFFQSPKSIRRPSCVNNDKVLEERWTRQGYRRPLHWVTKVADLEATVEFFKQNFGFSVFRHEEFLSGCEATCNGPYGGAWSKTMMGLGEKESETFALELTYNYGVSNYDRGNDLRYISMDMSSFVGESDLIQTDANGRKYVRSPDHWIMLESETGDEVQNLRPFRWVSLHVSNLTSSLEFYSKVLGACIIEDVESRVGQHEEISALLSWGQCDGMIDSSKSQKSHSVGVELVELPPGSSLVRAEAFGRFALETEDTAWTYLLNRMRSHADVVTEDSFAAAAGDRGDGGRAGRVLHGPIKLSPHGEEVVIIQDPDGHEFCFVDARGFNACTDVAKQQGKNTINWEYRKALHREAEQILSAAEDGDEDTGSAGAAETHVKKIRAADFGDSVLDYEGDVVLAVVAPWCKVCDARKPRLERVAAAFAQAGAPARFYAIDGSAASSRRSREFPLDIMVNFANSNGYPALYFLRADDKFTPLSFDDSWTGKDLCNWLRQCSTDFVNKPSVCLELQDDTDLLGRASVVDEDEDEDCDACAL